VNIVISNSSNDPIYLQIVNQIKEQIMNGKLAASDPLPSIRSLAKDLGISVITTKRAYDELEKDGLIVTVGGKGTFVAAVNQEMLREAKLKQIEEHLAEAAEAAKLLGLSLQELNAMLTLIYEE
jgi:GntR family transcriptional regulator